MDKEIIINILVIIGAALEFVIFLINILNFNIEGTYRGIIYLAIAIVLLLMVLRPGKPIPLNGLLLLFIAIICIVLAFLFWIDPLTLIAGILVLIASILELMNK